MLFVFLIKKIQVSFYSGFYFSPPLFRFECSNELESVSSLLIRYRRNEKLQYEVSMLYRSPKFCINESFAFEYLESLPVNWTWIECKWKRYAPKPNFQSWWFERWALKKETHGNGKIFLFSFFFFPKKNIWNSATEIGHISHFLSTFKNIHPKKVNRKRQICLFLF